MPSWVNETSESFQPWGCKTAPLMLTLTNTVFIKKRRDWKYMLLIPNDKGQEAAKCQWSGSSTPEQWRGLQMPPVWWTIHVLCPAKTLSRVQFNSHWVGTQPRTKNETWWSRPSAPSISFWIEKWGDLLCYPICKHGKKAIVQHAPEITEYEFKMRLKWEIATNLVLSLSVDSHHTDDFTHA